MPHHLTNRFPSEESRSEREFNNRETILPHPEFFWSVTFRCSSRERKRPWPTCHSLIYLRSLNFNKREDLRQKNRDELRDSGHRLLQSAGYVTIALRILCLWLVTARREEGGLQASVLVVKHALSFVSYIYRMDITLIISSIHISFRIICISSLYRPKRKVIL